MRRGLYQPSSEGLPAAPVDELAFQAGEEALGHGVVVGIAHTAHRRANAHPLAALAEVHAGVLAALDALLYVKRLFGSC